MVYLVKCASYNQGKAFYKIGFTNNLDKRLPQYITHNPTIQVVEIVDTYRKTKRNLESVLHIELLKNGYNFEVNNDITTEWFEVDSNKPITLKQFKACKNRKVIAL